MFSARAAEVGGDHRHRQPELMLEQKDRAVGDGEAIHLQAPGDEEGGSDGNPREELEKPVREPGRNRVQPVQELRETASCADLSSHHLSSSRFRAGLADHEAQPKVGERLADQQPGKVGLKVEPRVHRARRLIGCAKRMAPWQVLPGR